MTKYDLDTYTEQNLPPTAPMAAAVAYHSEPGHASQRNNTDTKESPSGLSNMRILEAILAIVVAGAVALGLVREFGSSNEAIGAVPPEEFERAFEFAPDAPNPACEFEDVIAINNANGDERLKLRAVVNEEDETVTIQAEREGNGWIGISINDNLGMVPNTAVIGTPADGLAEIYFLGGKNRGAIEKAAVQSIADAETLQEDDRVILSFTVGLNDFEDATVVPGGSTRIMWAIGNEGDSDFSSAHAFGSRGFVTIDIASCNVESGGVGAVVGATPFDFAPDAPVADCAFEDDFIVINNAEGEERLKFRAIVNERDETLSLQAERAGEGWIGISINDSQGMVPNVAAIGTPSDGKVEKYNLGGKARPSVTILNANEQSLSSTQTVHQDGRTLISFTIPLNDAGSSTVVGPGSTRIMWAIGADDDSTFSGAHAFGSRGFATIDLPSCGLAKVTSLPTQSPTSRPTFSPAQAPVVDEEEEKTLVFDFADGAGEDDVVLFQENAKVYAKTGNRRACQADVCPGTWWDLVQGGCSCTTDGLDSCHAQGSPVSLETYYGITYTETWIGSGKYTMSATGKETEFGAGGDHASADTCYDNWQRGGFKIDLTGTTWAFHEDSTIWVNGYSPSMKIWADNQVVEFHEYNQGATMSWNIPGGTRNLEVVCGGWPGNCWSELSAYKP